VLELLIRGKYYYVGLIVERNKTTTDLRHVPKINRLGMKRSKLKDPMILFDVSKKVSDADEDNGEIIQYSTANISKVDNRECTHP
jgi:hypothetical protein